MWMKLDDSFPTHPKVVRAGTDAAWLFIAGGCYCSKYLTDGMIPKEAVSTLTTLRGTARLAGVLVAVDLWHDRGDFFEVHDYLVYNLTREKVLEERDKAAKRRAKGGRASGERRATDDRASDALSLSLSLEVPDGTSQDPPPARPRNPHFDALVEIFGAVTTSAGGGMYAKAANDIKAAKGTPDDILERGNRMLQRGWDNPTPMALAKHWDALGVPIPPPAQPAHNGAPAGYFDRNAQ